MNSKIFVIGMAKSSLSLKNAGVSKNLELDVLRVIVCIQQLIMQGKSAIGYLLVYDEKIKNRIENKWLIKYGFKNRELIKILTFSGLPNEIIERIKSEKANNASFQNSVADISKKITEKILEEKILLDFPDKEYKLIIADKDAITMDINWDFKGIFEKKGSP